MVMPVQPLAAQIRQVYADVGVNAANIHEVGGPFPAFATVLRLPPGKMNRAFVDHFELFVPTRPLELIELSGEHERRKFTYRSGCVAFNPPGSNWSMEWDAVIEGLSLIIAEEVMNHAVKELFDEDPKRLRWRMALNDTAPAIAYLGLDVVSQASIGYPAGMRHFEQVVRALFSMIIRRYGSTPERDTATVGITSRTVLAALHHIERNLAHPMTIQSIADAAAASPPHLNRKFRSELGLSVWACVQEKRLRKASQLLEQTNKAIGEIGKMSGFATRSNFIKAFRASHGVSPTEFRLKTRA